MASFWKELSLDKTDLRGRFIGIIEEFGGEGNFIINCFIWESLREKDSSFCLLSLKHAFNHYFHIGLKLGYNLNSQKSRAVIIDALKTYVGCNFDENFLNACDELEFKKLFLLIQKNCDELLKKYQKVFLLIDDLSCFLSLGVPPKIVLTFCHYLRTLLTKNITLVVLTNNMENDQDALSFKFYLDYISDITFHVSPLRTGTAKDISGLISFNKKTSELVTKNVIYHYKLSERNIKLFPPGCL